MVALVVVVVYLFAYSPSFDAAFIWDDDSYIEQNRTLRNAEGLWRIWFEIGAIPQYYPLVHSTFWLEYQAWGLDPGGYHKVNVLIHLLAAALGWRLLRRLGLPGAGFAATLFLLHPVQVESVAWVTERKNVLSAVFYALAWLCWLRYSPLEGEAPARRAKWWCLAFLAFLGALFSKTVTASLPAAILLVGWWKLGRVRGSELRALLPFFVVGLALGAYTAYIEKFNLSGTGQGAVGQDWEHSPIDRGLIYGRVFWFYAAKLAWPASLAFVYPRWVVDDGVAWQYLYPLGVIALLASAWTLRRRIGRGPLVACLFFLGTLFPASGIFDVWPFQYSYVADHFQYLATMGLFALSAGGLCMLARARFPKLGPGGPAAGAGVVAVALMLGPITYHHAKDLTDLETLWNDTLDKNPDCWMAHLNLGVVLRTDGRESEAETHFRRALQLRQPNPEARINLSGLLFETGRREEAEAELRRLLDADPKNVTARSNLGVYKALQNDVDGAIRIWEALLEDAPDEVAGRRHLAEAYRVKGDLDHAIDVVRAGLEIVPRSPGLHLSLGQIHASRYRRAVLRSDSVDAREALAAARAAMEEALYHQPDYRDARLELQRIQGLRAP